MKCKFRRELRRKAYDYEVLNLEKEINVFDVDRCTFQKNMSKKRNKKVSRRNELKIGQRIVNDQNELLDVWKNHYMDLYSPQHNTNFDDAFKRHVEEKVKVFESHKNEDSNDPLEEPFKLDHIRSICQKLFKGKKKDRLQKCNYRGITLLNVIGKVFEQLMLDLWMPRFNELGIPHPNQFAYQQGRGCTEASFVLQEAVHHYIERGSKVYACFLDSSKAFDTVWTDGLFYKLHCLGINGCYVIGTRNCQAACHLTV